MKKFLLVCTGVGLAIGGGYLMYQGWRKYYQGHQGEDNDQDDNTVSIVPKFYSHEKLKERCVVK